MNLSTFSSEYESVIIAANEDRIHDWVLDFLEGVGNNKSLARVLRIKGEFHIGPIDYPIDRLTPILGPDESFKFYEDQTITDLRVAAMEKSFHEGWRPVPLIATDLWEDYLTVADGAHRQALLNKLGIETYPTIFYFRDRKSLDDFKDSLESKSNG